MLSDKKKNLLFIFIAVGAFIVVAVMIALAVFFLIIENNVGF
jgi:hypothetical protein